MVAVQTSSTVTWRRWEGWGGAGDEGSGVGFDLGSRFCRFCSSLNIRIDAERRRRVFFVSWGCRNQVALFEGLRTGVRVLPLVWEAIS